jgi:hypothetical protein
MKMNLISFVAFRSAVSAWGGKRAGCFSLWLGMRGWKTVGGRIGDDGTRMMTNFFLDEDEMEIEVLGSSLRDVWNEMNKKTLRSDVSLRLRKASC